MNALPFCTQHIDAINCLHVDLLYEVTYLRIAMLPEEGRGE